MCFVAEQTKFFAENKTHRFVQRRKKIATTNVSLDMHCSSNCKLATEVIKVWMPIGDKSSHEPINCNEIIEFNKNKMIARSHTYTHQKKNLNKTIGWWKKLSVIARALSQLIVNANEYDKQKANLILKSTELTSDMKWLIIIIKVFHRQKFGSSRFSSVSNWRELKKKIADKKTIKFEMSNSIHFHSRATFRFLLWFLWLTCATYFLVARTLWNLSIF